MDRALLMLVLTILQSLQETHCYKILALFPENGKSHMIMFESIMEELALRGHEVHVLSHYPRAIPLANYTDLSVLGSTPLPDNKRSFGKQDFFTKYDVFNLATIVRFYNSIQEGDDVIKSEAVQRLLRSTERYDLIITETFVMDMLLGFVPKFKVPFVLVCSRALESWANDFMASPQNPAFIPHTMSNFGPKMSFFERLCNAVGQVSQLVAWYGFFLPANQRLMNKYFGQDMPPLLDILKNASLVLTNTHSTIIGPRPYASNVIEVGGVHIKPAKKLPRDIGQFIDESKHGVIYFCMGSLLRTASLPEEKKAVFLNTFSRLKERVLWKFEDESLSTPDNVMIKAWMPQRDILAHPKIKLVISHGGLLGSLEAVSEGKPMVVIPQFSDQIMNAKSLEYQGVAKLVDYHTIDNTTFYEAIRDTMESRFERNAKELSRLFHDRPMTAMDTAIYWIDYVIRNNGARNLRTIAVDLPFYQYFLLDVVLFIVICIAGSGILVCWFLKCVFGCKNRATITRRKAKNQ